MSDLEDVFKEFLVFLDVESLKEVRKLDLVVVIVGNLVQIEVFLLMNYKYVFVVDNEYVIGFMLKKLQEGDFDKFIKILVVYNVFEGVFFFDLNFEIEEEFKDWVKVLFLGFKDKDYDYFVDIVYLVIYDGFVGYVDFNIRQMSVWGEVVVDCIYCVISEVIKNESYVCKY